MTCERLVITGIGGQGVILMTKIMARAAFEDGLTLNTLEALGGSIRGGPVYVQVRVGSPEVGAAVPYGTAEAVIALEGYEGLRVASKFLRPGGVVYQNTQLVQVPGHFRTKRKLLTLADLPELYARLGAHLVMVPAVEMAIAVGNPRLANLALFGVVVRSELLGISAETVRTVIARTVPRGTEEKNLAAFEAGYVWAAATEAGAMSA